MFGTPNISLLEIKTAFDLAFAHFVSIWVITCYNSHQYSYHGIHCLCATIFDYFSCIIFFAVLSPYIFLPWPLGGCSFVCSFLRDFSALLLLSRCWVAGWADVTIVYCVETATDHSCYTGWAKKTGLFLRSDNFATTDDRKACNTSKVSEFCSEWSA